MVVGEAKRNQLVVLLFSVAMTLPTCYVAHTSCSQSQLSPKSANTNPDDLSESVENRNNKLFCRIRQGSMFLARGRELGFVKLVLCS